MRAAVIGIQCSGRKKARTKAGWRARKSPREGGLGYIGGMEFKPDPPVYLQGDPDKSVRDGLSVLGFLGGVGLWVLGILLVLFGLIAFLLR